MNLEQYGPLARVTLKQLPFAEHMEHMGLGVVGEIGEFADGLKKFLAYNQGVDITGKRAPDGKLLKGVNDTFFAEDGRQIFLDKINLMEEGGDGWWYIVNYLLELELGADLCQKAFNDGLLDGANMVNKVSGPKVILRANARIATAVADLTVDELPELVTRMANVQIICRAMGTLYGFFGLDLSQSLDRNIAKLKVRYGDKFSAAAAQVRDLAGERAALEGNAANSGLPAPFSNELRNPGSGTNEAPVTGAAAEAKKK